MKLIFNIGYGIEDGVYTLITKRGLWDKLEDSWNTIYESYQDDEVYSDLLEKLTGLFRHKKL